MPLNGCSASDVSKTLCNYGSNNSMPLQSDKRSTIDKTMIISILLDFRKDVGFHPKIHRPPL